jgi:hypothetical protein
MKVKVRKVLLGFATLISLFMAAGGTANWR